MLGADTDASDAGPWTRRELVEEDRGPQRNLGPRQHAVGDAWLELQPIPPQRQPVDATVGNVQFDGLERRGSGVANTNGTTRIDVTVVDLCMRYTGSGQDGADNQRHRGE